MPPPQFVPISQVAGDVADFRNTLAVGRVVRAPDVQRIEVEILPIQVNSLLRQQLVNVVGQPLERVGIAQV